jgi:hypothetical protein
MYIQAEQPSEQESPVPDAAVVSTPQVASLTKLPGTLLKTIQSELTIRLLSTTFHAFIEMTLLWFWLPAEAYVQLRIFNSEGREVATKSANFLAGENHLILRRQDLPEPGIYTCRIETRFGSVSRKVLLY